MLSAAQAPCWSCSSNSSQDVSWQAGALQIRRPAYVNHIHLFKRLQKPQRIRWKEQSLMLRLRTDCSKKMWAFLTGWTANHCRWLQILAKTFLSWPLLPTHKSECSLCIYCWHQLKLRACSHQQILWGFFFFFLLSVLTHLSVTHVTYSVNRSNLLFDNCLRLTGCRQCPSTLVALNHYEDSKGATGPYGTCCVKWAFMDVGLEIYFFQWREAVVFWEILYFPSFSLRF